MKGLCKEHITFLVNAHILPYYKSYSLVTIALIYIYYIFYIYLESRNRCSKSYFVELMIKHCQRCDKDEPSRFNLPEMYQAR